jgi:signal transduction histidine kinase
LLNEILEETKLIVTTHPINWEVNGPVLLEADRDKIGSVISNLVSNAVKYSSQGKSVDITYRASEKEVTVAIKDEGIGIKAQDVNKIFDRYHRVKTEFSRHVSGFGIGLYLSSEIIELHGGKIWAESQYGQGSTFYFTLPLTVDNKTF